MEKVSAATACQPAPCRKLVSQPGIYGAGHRRRCWRTRAARGSRRSCSARGGLAGTPRQNSIVACACRPNWRWLGEPAGTWAALWRRTFDRSPLRGLARTRVHTSGL
eukprot:4376881-Pleurochrysis_carterae.AAC.4